jgi:hypothetical protein
MGTSVLREVLLRVAGNSSQVFPQGLKPRLIWELQMYGLKPVPFNPAPSELAGSFF